MGVGTPEDILVAVSYGIDCSTALSRQGWPGTDYCLQMSETLLLRTARFGRVTSPLDERVIATPVEIFHGHI